MAASPVSSRFTLDDIAWQHEQHRADSPAFVCGPTRLTWATFAQRVSRLAAAMAKDGVGEGARILWCGQNCHRLVEVLFAAAELGAVLCPTNWRQSADELAFVIDDCNPRLVFWQETEIGATVAAARGKATSTARWIQHDDTDEHGYENYLTTAPGEHRGRSSDPALPVLMMYTAAFDGYPNGALLSHNALLAQTMTLRLLEGVSADDTYLNSGPLFHIGSLRRTLAVAHAGGVNVMVPRVQAEQLCQLIDRERCTGAFLQPPTMMQMIELNADRRYDLTSLRTSGGPPGWEDMAGPLATPVARSGYGQTELAGVVTFKYAAQPTIGTEPGPLAYVDVVTPEGEPVGAGETGEIVVRGPMVMSGYHRRPELTARRLRHGRYHTSDLGRREADGSISFVGPAEKMIKSAAENIYPAEVERCLLEHHTVAQAAVLGVPDPVWGQQVKAVLVTTGEVTVTEDELTEHCRKRLARYKRPRSYEFTDALPVKDGRVDRDALDSMFGGGGYPGTN